MILVSTDLDMVVVVAAAKAGLVVVVVTVAVAFERLASVVADVAAVAVATSSFPCSFG